MRKNISSSEAREIFPELLNRVTYTKERFILKKRGKPVAALVSLEDLEALEAYEDERDSRLLREAVKASKGTLPLAELIEEYQAKHQVDLKDLANE